MAGKRGTPNVQARSCPDDFEIVFIEKGRVECESYFRARRTTITRWLIECGKDRLLKKRASYVRFQRAHRHAAKSPGDEPCACLDRRKVDPKLIELAIAHLQRRENGGWVVVPCENGGFVAGTRRRSAGQVLDLAISKGFSRRRAMAQIRAFEELI